MVSARPHIVCQVETQQQQQQQEYGDYQRGTHHTNDRRRIRRTFSNTTRNHSSSWLPAYQQYSRYGQQQQDDDGDTPLHKLFSSFGYYSYTITTATTTTSSSSTSNTARMDQNTNIHNDAEDDDEDKGKTTVEAIARVFIEANPLCVRIANQRGWLPLHTLCFHLFQAIHWMKPDFLKVLIDPYPESVTVENKGGVTPWDMLLSNFVHDGESCHLNVAMVHQTWDLSCHHHHHHHDRRRRYHHDCFVWACVLIMIERSKCGCGHDRIQQQQQRPLHLLASSFLVDAKLMEIGLLIHGFKSAMIQDEEGGNLPLHVASYHHSMTSSSRSVPIGTGVDHEAIEKVASKIQLLIKVYPNGTRVRNKQGSLPLFLAIETGTIGWEDGIRDMVEAYPESLYEKDPKHFLYPFC
jgi:hypothetical protein